MITKAFLKEYSKNINFIREYEIYCKHDGNKIFNNLLEKYIGDDVLIPFDMETRKKKYPLAFKELERYMIKYQNK